MSAIPEPRYTLEEYLARERDAPYKNEFYRGQIFAMSGGSPRHNLIAGNMFARLHHRLRGTGCRPYNSAQRIRIAAVDLCTYPDVSVICGELQLDRQDREAVVNPRVIIEVLSPTTESYNRSKKFDFYCELESLRDYILVAQDEPQVERFVRQDDGSWMLTVFKGLAAVLEFPALACTLPLSEIYQDVTFGPKVNFPPRALPS